MQLHTFHAVTSEQRHTQHQTYTRTTPRCNDAQCSRLVLLARKRREWGRATQRPLLNDLLDKVVAVLLDDPAVRRAEATGEVLLGKRQRVLLHRVKDHVLVNGDRVRADRAVLGLEEEKRDVIGVDVEGTVNL